MSTPRAATRAKRRRFVTGNFHGARREGEAVFPSSQPPSREGGPGICLIRGNILMSKRITSYVCINLSCPMPHEHAGTLALELCTHTQAFHCIRGHVSTITHRASPSPLNERYSIIFKFNESLVNNINELGIGRYRLRRRTN